MRDSTENQIELILIRHGETKANQEKRYLGKTDEPLSERGRDKLRERQYQPVQVLFGSPMRRCRQTAELLYPAMAYQAIAEWEEMDFGRFEGKNYEELKEDADYQSWIDSGGTLPFPGGESRETFICRCSRGLEQLLGTLVRQNMQNEKTVAAIVHGGTIMALLSCYGAGDYFDYQCKNGAGYQCRLSFALDSDRQLMRESIHVTEIKKC